MVLSKTCSTYLRLQDKMLYLAQGTLIDLQRQVDLVQNRSQFARDGLFFQGQFQRLQLKITSLAQARKSDDKEVPPVEIPSELASSSEKFFKKMGIQIGVVVDGNMNKNEIIFDNISGWNIDLKKVSYAQITAILGSVDKFVLDANLQTKLGESERSNFLDSKNAIQKDLSELYVSSFKLRINLISGLQV